MKSIRFLVLLGLGLWISLSQAQDEAFLPVHEAFKVEASEDGTDIVYRFDIADGYYLYKMRFGFDISDTSRGELGEPQYNKAGKWKDDPNFGRVEVFFHQVEVRVPVTATDAGFVEIDARYQGCAEKGLCYVPQTFTNMFQVDAPSVASPAVASPGPDSSGSGGHSSPAPESPSLFPTSQNQPPSQNTSPVDSDDAFSMEQFLANSNLLPILGVFFLVGLGLTFTPCVLPMVPILSGIIVGQGEGLTRQRAAALSLTYVLGMATTYAVLGVIAGVTGAKLQVALQTPSVLIGFAVVFFILALSMFGFFELQLPHSVQNRLNNMSQKQAGGRYIGVALIGIFSALVVSPCVSAPLAGALLYIGKSGDWVLGGSALLALGLGMGTPLLAIGIFGANILPKAGAWMDNVKGLFGVLLLAVALWLVKHLMPSALAWSLAGGLCILAGLYSGALESQPKSTGKFFKAIGLSAMVAGAGLILSSVIHTGVIAVPGANPASQASLPFQRVFTQAELEQQMAAAKAQRQPVMIDFYADWCSACLEMEHQTFSKASVQAKLAHYRWLQIDLTNNPEATALLGRFDIPGPPAILFFDSAGNERHQARILAYKSKERFLAHLDKHQLTTNDQLQAFRDDYISERLPISRP